MVSQVLDIVNSIQHMVGVGLLTMSTGLFTAAEDRDTPAENLTFAILSATAGHVAFTSSPATAIDRFTQAQLNSLQLLFVHSGQLNYFLKLC